MFNLQQWVPNLDPEWVWAVEVFVVLVITVLGNYVARVVFTNLIRRLESTGTRWDDVIIKAISRPLTWTVWLVGMSFAADIVYEETQNPIFTGVDSIRNVGILLCITWFMLSFVRGAEREFGENSDRMDRNTARALGKLIRLTIIITASMVVLQTLGFSIGGILAMGGIGGVAIGFAAKDLLSNFFGGLIIYLDRPFSTGEWIRSPDRNIEGTVEKIGWRITRVRSFESLPIYIPNSVFTNIVVENPSRMANRRIYETIGLRYSDLCSMDKIVIEVTEMLTAHEAIDTKKTMIVNFNAFSDSSVDFFVYSFTKTTQWIEFHKVKQDVMLKVAEIIESNNAEIAFPTSTLHMGSSVTIENS